MTRKTFEDLLGEGVRAAAGEARTPPDIADRALVRARRRIPVRPGAVVGGVMGGVMGVVVAVAASVLAVLVVVRPALSPAGSAGGGGPAGGCPPALVASYLTAPGERTAPTAHVYDWDADQCGQYARTRYAWAVDNYERVVVLGRAGDAAAAAPAAARELGILGPGNADARWVRLPAPAWAAYWSPDHGRKVLASLVRSRTGEEAAYPGYVIVDPGTGRVEATVELDEPALTPFQWAPDGRQVLAAFPDGVRLFDLNGRVTRTVPVSGLIPAPAAVSPDGERILLQRRQHVGSGRYLVVSVADGEVLARVDVGGTALVWMCGDAVLAVDRAGTTTELFAYELSPGKRLEPSWETFGPEVDTVIPRMDMLYEPCTAAGESP